MTQDTDPALAAIQESLDTVLKEIRRTSPTITYSTLYDVTYVVTAHQLDVSEGERICHRLAGSSCVVVLAARRIIALEDELKAVKEIFNLP